MHATPLYCAESARRDTAERLAARFALPLVKQRPDSGYWLELGPERLELVTTGKHGAVYAEFVAGAAKHRREQGGGRGQPVAKAVGLKGAKDLPRVVDATAGLGGDSFVLATLGCEVTLLERSPAYFVNRPVVVDVSALPQKRPDLMGIVNELQARKIRVMALEGTETATLGADARGLPPIIADGRPSTPIESCVKTWIARSPISAASRRAGRQ